MSTTSWSQRRLERRLARLHSELVAARDDVTVAEEQLAAFAEDADEARVRSLVSENRQDLQISRQAEGHREVMERALDKARRRVEELAGSELELLARIEP